MNMPSTFLASATLLALGAAVSTALAGGSSSTMTVRAQFAEFCTASATPLDFGELQADNRSSKVITGSVSVDCSANLPFHLSLDAGQHFNPATPTMRRMVGAADSFVRYAVLLPESGPNGPLWGDHGYGDTFAAGEPYNTLGRGQGLPHTLNFTAVAYGVVHDDYTSANGDFTDSLTLAITY